MSVPTELLPHTLYSFHPLRISSLQWYNRHAPRCAPHHQSQFVLRGLPTKVPIRLPERHAEQRLGQRDRRPLAPRAESHSAGAQDRLRLDGHLLIGL